MLGKSTILITGASGYIGSYLRRRFTADGHEVHCLSVTGLGGAGKWDPDRDFLDPALLGGIDYVINLAGAGIADRRWTAQRKHILRSSRIRSAGLLARCLGSVSTLPRMVLSASAVGYYGDCGKEKITEEYPPGSSFLAALCTDWENCWEPLIDKGMPVAKLRFGAVIGKGGMLARLAPVYRCGLGGKLGGGSQLFSWISLPDVYCGIKFVMQHLLCGPINFTAPEIVSNKEFSDALARIMHRPALLTVPAWVLRAAFGEMADELLLSSVGAVPRRLTEAGYEFTHIHLADALSDIEHRS